MKIIVTSDDGKVRMEVPTEDIDFEGHTLNRAVLDKRLWETLFKVACHEIEATGAKS